jgi:hypothetical protein
MVWSFRVCLVLIIHLCVLHGVYGGLFINSRLSPLSKMQRFSQFYRDVNSTIATESVQLEDRITGLIKYDPLLATRTGLSFVIVLVYFADFLHLMPTQVRSKIISQGCFSATLVKAMDLLPYLNISDFIIRDSYVEEELGIAACEEMRNLVVNEQSQTLAYYVTCLFTNKASCCIMPFFVSEFPSILRYALAVAGSIAPLHKDTVGYALTPLLFDVGNVHDVSSNGTNSTTNVSTAILPIDRISSEFSKILEISTMVVIFFELCRTNVRGVKDIGVNIVRLLVVLQFIRVRSKGLFDSSILKRSIDMFNVSHLLHQVELGVKKYFGSSGELKLLDKLGMRGVTGMFGKQRPLKKVSSVRNKDLSTSAPLKNRSKAFRNSRGSPKKATKKTSKPPKSMKDTKEGARA